MNTTARTLAFAGLVGPVWFTSLVILQGVLQPDPKWRDLATLHAVATAAV